MHHGLRVLVAGIFSMSASLVAFAGDGLAMDQAKHDDIKALLQLTGALNTAQTVVNSVVPQMLGLIRTANPSISQELIDQAVKDSQDEIKKAIPEFVEPMITVYDEHFTGDEIKQILAFYRSPIGQKLIAKQPELVQQGMVAGRAWGKMVGERLVARLRAEGYKL